MGTSEAWMLRMGLILYVSYVRMIPESGTITVFLIKVSEGKNGAKGLVYGKQRKTRLNCLK
jgi:hypothetical protein